jgi:exopolysaccharide biosynthesis polyprenyl glycosylphosphotransferase
MESESHAILEDRRGVSEALGTSPAQVEAGTRRLVYSSRARRDTLARDTVERRLLVVADIAAAAIALFIFVPLIGDDTLNLATLAGLPIVVLMSKIGGLYDRDDLLLRKTTLEEVPALFRMATLYALVIWLLESVLIVGQFGKWQVIALWLGLFVAMVATRAFARAQARWILPPERCLVLGDPGSAERIRERLAESRNIDAEVCAEMPLVPRRQEDLEQGVSAWSVDVVNGVARRFGAHRIVLAPDHAEGEAMLDLVRLARESNLKVTILPRVLEVVGSEIEPDDLDGMTVLAVRHSALSKSSRALKRGFDLIGASLALVLFAPLMAVFAIAIRLDSRGPALFRQMRMGRGGKPFQMLKFRTMAVGADEEKEALRTQNEVKGGLFKIFNDPRVTRVGRVIRRTSLDELPQLFNVLKGEMSLVGPRPLPLEEDEQIVGWRRSRLDLVPGVTGPWQLLGPHRVSLDEMVKLDYIYVGRWSVWNDAKILLRTALHAVALRGS